MATTAAAAAAASFAAFEEDGAPAWPVDMLPTAAPATKAAVLVTTGAMNPIHRGHVAMLDRAADKLSSLGIPVIGGWLSPSHDLYVGPKMSSLGTLNNFVPARHRINICRGVIKDHDRWRCSTWEASVPSHWPDFPEVCQTLAAHIDLVYPESDVHVYYVCGADHARKCGLDRGGLAPTGVVIIPRANDAGDVDRPDLGVLWASANEAVEDGVLLREISSTAVRDALADGDISSAAALIGPTALSYVCEHGLWGAKPSMMSIDLDAQRASLRWPELKVFPNPDRSGMQRFTPFTAVAPSLEQLGELAARSRELDRAMGCMVGLAVADSVGHPLEFLPVASDAGEGRASWSLADVVNSGPVPSEADQAARCSLRPFEVPYAPGYKQPLNRFGLDAGQWTDDCSMSLCLADSLLKRGRFDGSDVRLHFWTWWFESLNNAFRKDERRVGSVGLGGNISRSLYSMEPGAVPTPTYEAQTADAGNGSIMRLAPIALFHLNSPPAACAEDARRSSLTTHPGPIAAEACAFLAHLLVRAIKHFDAPPAGGPETDGAARAFLVDVADKYDVEVLAPRADEPGVGEMRRLLRAAEPDASMERCWNWRGARLDIGATMAARGDEYNGYPNSAGYFGSYCLDGLAMALHSVAMTNSFDAAIERCVNLLGDADSTGAIAGQIAGAMYGYGAIHERLRAHLHLWDDGQIALRAALLVSPVVFEL